MTKKITVAATQMSCSWNLEDNLKKAERLVRAAAAKGANIILLQELFETPYFCQSADPEHFKLASELGQNRAVARFREMAKELGVALPISFFEKKNNARYNSLAMIDADGEVLGVYRKTHIPAGPGYDEKYYFNPGDTGFKVFDTKFAKIGVGICWDQWFPESARCMALMGAEIIFYPTAIGSEPKNPDLDSKNHWQNAQRGHAASNMVPVVASNRIGAEKIADSQVTFYGSSFIAGPEGELLAEADKTSETFIIAEFDLDAIADKRAAWGLFRDRRPEMYGPMLSSDGDK